MIKNLKVRKNIEFTKELNDEIELFAKQNTLNFTQVLNLALQKFISEGHTITFTPVKTKRGR